MVAHTAQDAAAIVAEIDRQKRTARDLIVPANRFAFENDPELGIRGRFDAGIGDAITALPLSPTAHAQTAAKLGIPKPYYDRMAGEAPDLLADNVNTWTGRAQGGWLIRQLDGRIRANLSDAYRVLDNHDLFFASYETARKAGAEISRVSLSDDRFEMRLIAPGWREEIDFRKASGRKGQGGPGGQSVMIPGCYVSNSETGKGGLNIKPFVLDLVCLNGMVGEQAFTKVHLGSRNEAGYLSAETRGERDKVLWLEVRDLIGATFDRDRFKALVADMAETAQAELAEPVEAVDAVVAAYEMSDDDRQAILNELVSPSHDRDPGRTIFGLMCAVTERAKAYADSDPERATDLEEAGYELMAGKARELVKVR